MAWEASWQDRGAQAPGEGGDWAADSISRCSRRSPRLPPRRSRELGLLHLCQRHGTRATGVRRNRHFCLSSPGRGRGYAGPQRKEAARPAGEPLRRNSLPCPGWGRQGGSEATPAGLGAAMAEHGELSSALTVNGLSPSQAAPELSRAQSQYPCIPEPSSLSPASLQTPLAGEGH